MFMKIYTKIWKQKDSRMIKDHVSFKETKVNSHKGIRCPNCNKIK